MVNITSQVSGYWSWIVKKLLHLKYTLSKVDELLLLVRTNFDKLGKQLAMFPYKPHRSLNTPKYLLVAFSGARLPHNSTQCSLFYFKVSIFNPGSGKIESQSLLA